MRTHYLVQAIMNNLIKVLMQAIGVISFLLLSIAAFVLLLFPLYNIIQGGSMWNMLFFLISWIPSGLVFAGAIVAFIFWFGLSEEV